MTNDELESKISKALKNATPDIFDSIIEDIGTGDAAFTENKISESNVIKFKTDELDVVNTVSSSDSPVSDKKKKRSPWIARGFFVAAAAAAAVVGTTFGVSSYTASTAVASTVSIDVNPSIEIEVNKDRKVLSVIPKSEDAKEVVGNMDFKGADLEVAVNALLGSMISKGYLSEIANSILVSVDNADPATAADLQDLLMEEINEMVSSDTFTGAILGQTISNDEELTELAEKYGITLSKAQLIKQITTQNPTLKFEELVQLTINELNLLKRGDSDAIKSIGAASDIAYIGEQRAVDIALGDAGFVKEDTHFLKVEMDYENGSLCYEVSFHKFDSEYGSDFDYDYDIDALTGEITGVEKEIENLHELKDVYTEGEMMGEEKAKEIAFTLAGVDPSSVYEYEFEEDSDSVVPHYDIEFKSAGYEYDYSINAYDGTIYKNKWEREDDTLFGGEVPPPTDEEMKGFIGEEKAKAIAFEHSGVNDVTAYDVEIEIERDNGSVIYEVEFKSGIYDYSYDIDPVTGVIVDYEMDFDD